MTARLDDVHGTFRRWLGPDYDLDAINAVLATGAAERLDGDPLWTMVLGGSGISKTETVQSLAGAGAVVTSTLSSEAALLSATPKREKETGATGGLLRRLGERGLLVIKDVTSILSMHRDTRASLLAALREIHDGRWERNVGTGGGRSLAWTGRLGIVGAVTTAWDRAHDVIASMGDRFVVIRLDSTKARVASGRQAIANTGREVQMRQELAEVVGAALEAVGDVVATLPTAEETTALLAAADLVTLCRTGVDYDHRGDVVDAHAPEMPTRFAKQLVQVLRGAYAVGLDRPAALRLALRCARDSMPPLRLAILLDVAAHPGSRTPDVRRRLNKPRNTIDRQLQALHMLGVLTCDESQLPAGKGSIWRYFVPPEIDPNVLDAPEMSDQMHRALEGSVGSDKSGAFSKEADVLRL